MKFFLNDPEFDAQLQRTANAVNSGSADLGEVLATASRIAPGNLDDWFVQWSALAKATGEKAAAAAKAGHSVTAGKAYLRATEYWRQSIFFIRRDLDDKRLQRGYQEHRQAFRFAIPFLPYSVTTAEIPLAGSCMGAYLLRPNANTGTVRPTILAPCGYDSTAEAGYSDMTYMALSRGYNVMLWDGPGQGGMLYEQRVPMRPDFENVLTLVIDWAIKQPGVDTRRLVLVGRSFAGYLAPRAAAFERRLAALVCDPGQVEFVSRIVPKMFDETTWQRVLAGDATLDKKLEDLINSPLKREWYGARMTTHGAKTVGDFLRQQPAFSVELLAGQIQCPTLVTDGEGDFASQSQKLFDLLTCEKKLIRFTAAQGAGGHCCGLGQTLWEEAVFNWLDDLLAWKKT
ncbi:MAG: alpha/beta fold hydrolase [Limisphaerales bacterium]